MRVISGTARGTQLKTPDGMLTRPTADRVKEALFSILQFDIPGTEVLDLFVKLNELGNTIVMITHDEKVAKYAHRVVRIVDGQLLE